MVLGGESADFRERFRPSLHEEASVPGQLVIPEGEFFRLRFPLADALQQVVALDQDAFETRAGRGVLLVDLHEGEVNVATAQRRRSVDHLEIIGAEKDGHEPADSIRKALRRAVDFDGLRGYRPACSGPGNYGGLYLQRPDVRFRLGDDARGGQRVVQQLPADKLRISFYAQAAHRREQINRFQEIGLALSIVPDEERYIYGKLDIQTRKVSVIEELEAGQPHTGIIFPA